MNDRSTESDNREIFVWRRDGSDEARLTTLIAQKAIAEIFNEEGTLVYLHNGRFIRITKETMREIVNRHIVAQRLVNHGTIAEPKWDVEYSNFEFPLAGSNNDLNRGPNERTLIKMIDALSPLVSKAPRRPVALTEQTRSEIKARLKTGEPAARIAAAYRVEVDEIKELAQVR